MQTIKLDVADDNMVQNIKLQGDTHYEETKAYFHNALKEIENANDELLSQKEYDKKMDEFEKTL